jgi:hypothetical protein
MPPTAINLTVGKTTISCTSPWHHKPPLSKVHSGIFDVVITVATIKADVTLVRGAADLVRLHTDPHTHIRARNHEPNHPPTRTAHTPTTYTLQLSSIGHPGFGLL